MSLAAEEKKISDRSDTESRNSTHGPIYEVDLESQPLCVLNLRQSVTFAPTAKGLQRGARALR